MSLHDLGLPPEVVESFIAGGVRTGTVYPWQRAAIDMAADGSNLVYCAPTNGGKSLVAVRTGSTHTPPPPPPRNASGGGW